MSILSDTVEKGTSVTVIKSDEDVERMRQGLQDEMGMTDAQWWQETDPTDPPFKAGDRVWIDSIPGGVPNELIPALRTPQTVEAVMPIPCSSGPLWNVDLVGIELMLTQLDLRKAE